jgi:hypothetical protein
LRKLEGAESGYDFWGNNCRGFSNMIFDEFKEIFGDGKGS